MYIYASYARRLYTRRGNITKLTCKQQQFWFITPFVLEPNLELLEQICQVLKFINDSTDNTIYTQHICTIVQVLT